MITASFLIVLVGFLRNAKCDVNAASVSTHHKIGAPPVSAQKRVGLPRHAVAVPPAGDVLQHQMRKVVEMLQTLCRVELWSTCFSCDSEVTRTLQISQWKVRS